MVSSSEPFKYRRYYTTEKAGCSGCGIDGPQSFSKTSAAEKAKKAGWYVGTCFFCPSCKELLKSGVSKEELRAKRSEGE